jgi:hypothetical protein
MASGKEASGIAGQFGNRLEQLEHELNCSFVDE